jgi:hypothetical protein
VSRLHVEQILSWFPSCSKMAESFIFFRVHINYRPTTDCNESQTDRTMSPQVLKISAGEWKVVDVLLFAIEFTVCKLSILIR